MVVDHLPQRVQRIIAVVNLVIMINWTIPHSGVHWLLYGIVNTAICSALGYIFSLIIPPLKGERNKNLSGLTVWTARPKNAP